MLALYAVRGQDGKSAAHALLARAVVEVFGLSPPPAIARLPGGKPYFPSHPSLCFNYSHSGPFALCAVGDRSVGVDIELVRPRGAGLPRRALASAELRWLGDRGGGWPDFYTLWTRKESFVKYTGEGLHSFRQDHPPLPGDPGDGSLRLRSYSGPDWAAAVCAEEEPGSLIWLPGD